MAVTYDAVKEAFDFGVTTLNSGNFTIGAGADRAAIVVLACLADPGAITSVTCGGQSGTAIPGASGNNTYWWFAAYKVINPASGTQSASVTWTNSVTACVGVITATGVDQTTAVNGGNYAQAAADNVTIQITSTSGDLTATFSANDNASTTGSTNQTSRLATVEMPIDTNGGGGTTSHIWTHSGAFNVNAVGANFIAASGGGGGGVPAAWLKA